MVFLLLLSTRLNFTSFIMFFALEESDIKEKQESSSLCPSGSRCSAPKASFQVVPLLKEEIKEREGVAGETTDVPHSPTEASKADKVAPGLRLGS